MAHLFRRLAGAFAFLVVLALPVSADPAYPAFSAPVVDAAHVLSDADKAAITRKLFDLQLSTGVQFAVATVPSLEGLEIEPYANGLFRNWKIGQKGVNNGLLLLVAPTEHKLRFEVGYGLEGTMTDLQTKLIQRNTMVPKLKAGDTAGAIRAGVDDAITVLTKDKASLPDRLKPAPVNDTGDMILGFFVIFLVMAVIVVIVIRVSRGSGWGSFLAGAALNSFTSSSGSSGGDSSSSGGGDSFSGGGGGDSGGGGSSDSW